jgi:hypothetical protein
MVTDIITGISQKIYTEFGAEFEIYGDEDVKQGFTEPCFFIALLESTQTRCLGSRNSRRYFFDIHYFSDEEYSDLYQIADDLYKSLQYFEVNDAIVEGKAMHYEVIDGVLHFFVSVDMFVIALDAGEPEMETVAANIQIKE